MEVYRIEEDNLRRVPDSSLEYEQTLEEHLLKSRGAEIGGVEMLYVSRQGTPDKGGVFDILALDEHGNTVIVELKREMAPRGVVTQALEYASGIRAEGYDQLNERYQAFLREVGGDGRTLRDAHAEFFDRADDPLSEREFNNEQRLVVIGTEFRDVTLNMADLLRDHDLDVVCVEYQAFETTEGDLQLLTTENIRRPLSKEPAGTADDSPSEIEKVQQEFWDGFASKLADRPNTPLYTDGMNPRSYLPQKRNLPTGCDYALVTNATRGHLQVKLHLRDDGTEMFDYLREHRQDIESTIGAELEWATGGAYDTVILQRDGNIKTNRDEWDEYHEWFIEYGEAFHETFGSYLRRFNE